MRKLVSIFVIFAILFTVGCSSAPKPESTVSEFIEAGKKFDFIQMRAKINPSNLGSLEKITDLNKEDSENIYQKHFFNYFKENATKITYTVKASKIENDKAIVSVNLKYVNGGPLLIATLGDVLGRLMTLALSGTRVSDEETGQMFIDSLEAQKKNNLESFTEKTLDIQLIMLDKKWYIDKPNEEFIDIFLSNFISVMNELNRK